MNCAVWHCISDEPGSLTLWQVPGPAGQADTGLTCSYLALFLLTLLLPQTVVLMLQLV